MIVASGLADNKLRAGFFSATSRKSLISSLHPSFPVALFCSPLMRIRLASEARQSLHLWEATKLGWKLILKSRLALADNFRRFVVVVGVVGNSGKPTALD